MIVAIYIVGKVSEPTPPPRVRKVTVHCYASGYSYEETMQQSIVMQCGPVE